MVTSVIEKLRMVQDFLESSDFKHALEVLDSIDVAALDPQAAATYYALHSYILHYSGDYENALEASQACLDATILTDHRAFALQRHLHGKILQQLGRIAETKEAYTESYTRLQAMEYFAEAVLPLDSLASVHHLQGDFAAALRTLDQQIQLRIQHDLEDGLPLCWNNEARILVLLGDMHKAGAALRAVVRANPEERFRYSANYLKGMIACFRRERTAANALLMRSLEYYRNAMSAREEIICLEYLGLNEHFAGNHARAREYYEGILAREQITASARAQTLRMLSDVCVAEGKYAEAMTVADQAEVAINQINERIEIGCLHRARMRIAAATGDDNEARKQFASSVEMLQMIGAKYELAETYLAGGQFDCFTFECRHQFLKQAILLFVRCGVTARAAVASSQLERLLPPMEEDTDSLASPLADCYIACQLMQA